MSAESGSASSSSAPPAKEDFPIVSRREYSAAQAAGRELTPNNNNNKKKKKKISTDDLVKFKGPDGEDVFGIITATGWDEEDDEDQGEGDMGDLDENEMRELLAQYGIKDLSQLEGLAEEEGTGESKQRVLRLNEGTKDKVEKLQAAKKTPSADAKPFGAAGATVADDDDDGDDDDDADGDGEDDLGGVDEGFGQRERLDPKDVAVQILGGGDAILPLSEVTLVDKSLCPGDIVLRRSDPTSQSGVVQSVKTFLDIYSPAKNQILYNVCFPSFSHVGLTDGLMD